MWRYEIKKKSSLAIDRCPSLSLSMRNSPAYNAAQCPPHSQVGGVHDGTSGGYNGEIGMTGGQVPTPGSLIDPTLDPAHRWSVVERSGHRTPTQHGAVDQRTASFITWAEKEVEKSRKIVKKSGFSGDSWWAIINFTDGGKKKPRTTILRGNWGDIRDQVEGTRAEHVKVNSKAVAEMVIALKLLRGKVSPASGDVSGAFDLLRRNDISLPSWVVHDHQPQPPQPVRNIVGTSIGWDGHRVIGQVEEHRRQEMLQMQARIEFQKQQHQLFYRNQREAESQQRALEFENWRLTQARQQSAAGSGTGPESSVVNHPQHLLLPGQSSCSPWMQQQRYQGAALRQGHRQSPLVYLQPKDQASHRVPKRGRVVQQEEQSDARQLKTWIIQNNLTGDVVLMLKKSGVRNLGDLKYLREKDMEALTVVCRGRLEDALAHIRKKVVVFGANPTQQQQQQGPSAASQGEANMRRVLGDQVDPFGLLEGNQPAAGAGVVAVGLDCKNMFPSVPKQVLQEAMCAGVGGGTGAGSNAEAGADDGAGAGAGAGTRPGGVCEIESGVGIYAAASTASAPAAPEPPCHYADDGVGGAGFESVVGMPAADSAVPAPAAHEPYHYRAGGRSGKVKPHPGGVASFFAT
jgi:hypothetical protein